MNKKYFNSYSKFIYFNLITLILFITTGLVTEIFTMLDVEATDVNSTENNTNLITETTSDLNTVSLNAETTTSTNCDITKSEPESTTIESTTITQKSNNSSYEEDSYGRYYWFKASCTAYCGCSKCCGKYAANSKLDEEGKPIILTASGSRATPKYTISMNSNFKFGTMVYIDGIGLCEVMDRGSAVKGNVIDIYFDSHEEALNWGRKSINVKIYVD